MSHGGGKTRRQASRQNAQGNGNDAAQDSLSHGGPVLLPQQAHGHGDGEDHGGPQHGAGEDASQSRRLRAQSQLPGQGSAAHVAGQKGSGEHGGVCPEKSVNRHNDGPQKPCQHRGQAHDADHGKSQGAHGENPLFKPGAQAKPAAEYSVNTAKQGENRHDSNENLVEGHSGFPLLTV